MIQGFLDLLDHDQVEGWVQDMSAPQSAVTVLVICDGVVVGRATADIFRDDLLKAGIGAGCHGFSLKFATSLSPHRKHVVRVCTDNGVDLSGSPATLEPSPETTLAVPLVGSLDVIDRHHVTGWSRGAGDEAVNLIVTVNDELSGRVIANQYRADLEAAGVGNGRHAFEHYFVEPLSMGQRHVVRIRQEHDGTDLPGSPVTVEPPLAFDAATEAELSDLLARFSRDDEIERKIGFLANELSRLVERKAEIDSKASVRRRNRDLARRWGPARADAAPIESNRPRALVIDDRLPVLDRDAGSNAIHSHMRSLRRLGFDVSLIASTELWPVVGLPSPPDGGFEILSLPFYGSVEELLWRQAGEFDVVYLHRVSNAAKYGELVRQHFPKARRIFSVADLHHVRMLRQADVENRPELVAAANRIKFAELLAAASANVVITHSDYEAGILKTNLPKAQIHRVLWSAEPKPTRVAFAKRKGIAFIGGFDHAPNIDAAKWLIGSLMPLIRERDPEIVCYLVGSNFPAELARSKTDGIVVMGKVDDLGEIFDRVRLTVAPLSYGAGVKGKIIDSLAAGVPCVYTSIAGEGMSLPAALDCCRGDDPRTIADAVIRLHRDAALNRNCSKTGLAYVREQLSEQALDQAMRDVVGAGARAAIQSKSPKKIPGASDEPAKTATGKRARRKLGEK